MDNQTTIRRKLIDYMYDNNVTLKYISERSYINYNLLSKFKNNKIELELETLIALEIFLNLIQDD